MGKQQQPDFLFNEKQESISCLEVVQVCCYWINSITG